MNKLDFTKHNNEQAIINAQLTNHELVKYRAKRKGYIDAQLGLSARSKSRAGSMWDDCYLTGYAAYTATQKQWDGTTS